MPAPFKINRTNSSNPISSPSLHPNIELGLWIHSNIRTRISLISSKVYFLTKSRKILQDPNFILKIKGQASRHQKTTISKPNSVISGSSFSLPISYYDHTTPYPIGAHLDDEENENEFNDQDDFGEGFQGPDDGTTDSSIEVKDIVQAFNPYVKVI